MRVIRSTMLGMLKGTALLLAAGAIVAIAATSSSSVVHREVAGHQFKVPKDYLFDATIAWLPAPEADSFTFLLEPNPHNDRIPEHRILVERLDQFCPSGAKKEMLKIVCGEEKPTNDDGPPYEKIQNDLGAWSSDLFAVRRNGASKDLTAKRPVAFCQLFEPNPAKPEPSTLCTTFWAYRGMMLQFSFDEKQAPEMRVMKAKAMALLDSWEVR